MNKQEFTLKELMENLIPVFDDKCIYCEEKAMKHCTVCHECECESRGE